MPPGGMKQDGTLTAVGSELQQHRRNFIVRSLLAGEKRADIARDLGIGRTTLNRWIDADDQLADQLKEVAKTWYADAMDEIRGIAFADVEPNAHTKLAALKIVRESCEETVKDLADAITPADVQRLLTTVVMTLEQFPEAREAVLAVFERERGRHVPEHQQSGDVPAQLPDNSDTGA